MTIVKIEKGGVITIPADMIKSLGWTENTFVEMYLDGDKVIIKEKTDWTVADLQENIETIIERISENRRCHHILVDGNTFVLAPYGDEDIIRQLQTLKNQVKKIGKAK